MRRSRRWRRFPEAREPLSIKTNRHGRLLPLGEGGRGPRESRPPSRFRTKHSKGRNVHAQIEISVIPRAVIACVAHVPTEARRPSANLVPTVLRGNARLTTRSVSVRNAFPRGALSITHSFSRLRSLILRSQWTQSISSTTLSNHPRVAMAGRVPSGRERFSHQCSGHILPSPTGKR